MPSRAQQMTPAQMYEMAPSRYSVLNQVLSNKKALDAAFMEHTFRMRQEAQKQAGGERRAMITGQLGIERQKLANQGRVGSNIDFRARQEAMRQAQAAGFIPGDPEFDQIVEQFYQMLTQGGGAMRAAGGSMPRSQYQEGTIAVNPTTKKRIQYRGGKWVPM